MSLTLLTEMMNKWLLREEMSEVRKHNTFLISFSDSLGYLDQRPQMPNCKVTSFEFWERAFEKFRFLQPLPSLPIEGSILLWSSLGDSNGQSVLKITYLGFFFSFNANIFQHELLKLWFYFPTLNYVKEKSKEKTLSYLPFCLKRFLSKARSVPPIIRPVVEATAPPK